MTEDRQWTLTREWSDDYSITLNIKGHIIFLQGVMFFLYFSINFSIPKILRLYYLDMGLHGYNCNHNNVKNTWCFLFTFLCWSNMPNLYKGVDLQRSVRFLMGNWIHWYEQFLPCDPPANVFNCLFDQNVWNTWFLSIPVGCTYDKFFFIDRILSQTFRGHLRRSRQISWRTLWEIWVLFELRKGCTGLTNKYS